MEAGEREHMPVLASETLELLDPQAGETALDCTAGLGGHAALLAERVGASGRMILNDLDPWHLERAAARVRAAADAAVETLRGNFAEAPRKLAERGWSADVVLADLGFASSQVEDPERGLSFRLDGPLDMRLDPQGPLTAAELVNTGSEEELAEIIRDFGEERMARRVARKIVASRAERPIETTGRLASIVRSAVHSRPGQSRIDPATRTFQALRIAVNDELGSLTSLLESVRRTASVAATGGGEGDWLAPGARIGVISFHSLEDRLVKRAFVDLVERELAEGVTRKPVTASEEEQRRNPRARSAKLRVIRLKDLRRERAGR